MKLRAVSLLLMGTALAPAAALAQTTLPNGLVQSGGVIMMQPIPDGSTGPESGERRQAAVHFLSAGDHALYTRAFDAAGRGDWTAARSLAMQGHDAAAMRLITWRYLLDKNSGASFGEIDSFLKTNPDWPMRDALLARAEAAMDAAMSPSAVVAWFAGRPPQTGIGMIRLGDALIATGRTSDGRQWVQQGWITGSFTPEQELDIVRRDGGLFTPDTDRARLNSLISRDETTAAQRELARVDAPTQALGKARLALRTNRALGERLAAALPASVANDPELLFDRARAARRANEDAMAARLLDQASLKAFAATHPTRWWPEVNLVARDLIANGSYSTAYAIVADSGLTSGSEFSDSEFMAGWIALRYLKSPQRALPHFRKLEAGVTRPISLARARYWTARCYEAMGQTQKATDAYRSAAQAPDSFYGQLALARIDPTPVLHVNDMQVDGDSVRGAFDADDLLAPMRALADLGESSYLRIFAQRDQELHPDPRRVKLLMQTMVDWGYREIAVRLAKTQSYAGMTMLAYSHPMMALPAYSGPGAAPDPAIVLGLIRQETEFDPDAVSRAGARGLMQLMPATAQNMAARAGLPYRPNALTTDPAYNVQLGMVTFATSVEHWNGSLVLAIAAYNAGPGNVAKWVAANGDPRSPAVDPVDWIELIPFNETRNYVQRVLENAQIYRNRLAGRDVPTRILQDLYAPLPPQSKVVSLYP